MPIWLGLASAGWLAPSPWDCCAWAIASRRASGVPLTAVKKVCCWATLLTVLRSMACCSGGIWEVLMLEIRTSPVGDMVASNVAVYPPWTCTVAELSVLLKSTCPSATSSLPWNLVPPEPGVGVTVNIHTVPRMPAVPIGVTISMRDPGLSFLAWPIIVPAERINFPFEVVGSEPSLFQASSLASIVCRTASSAPKSLISRGRIAAPFVNTNS